MMSAVQSLDCELLVVGGGFYGCMLAAEAAERGTTTILIEATDALLTRASSVNQARLHNGYHYPRALPTAYRSRVNYARFAVDFSSAVDRSTASIYAVARQGHVSARQFTRFCGIIGAPLERVSSDIWSLFDPRLVEDAWVADESVFDAQALAGLAADRLRQSGATVVLGSEVVGIQRADPGIRAQFPDGSALHALRGLNCTYAGLNRLLPEGSRVPGLKHEIAELALVKLPSDMQGLAVTVMDGPFFSTLPFPAHGCSSLTHVRYTPRVAWLDDAAPGVDPYRVLERDSGASSVERMIRDATRFVPAMRDVQSVGSLREVKTVLARNELDDGRPILYYRHAELPLCSVLGGKVDNIYDILEHAGPWLRPTRIGSGSASGAPVEPSGPT